MKTGRPDTPRFFHRIIDVMRTTLIAACLLAALGAVAMSGCSKTEPAPEPVRAVRTMTLKTGQSGGTLEYAGEVRARIESRLGFRIGGKSCAAASTSATA